MEQPKTWNKLETWSKDIKDARVEIKHWYYDSPAIPNTCYQGQRVQRVHKWNIYAIIYPKHPIFSKIDQSDMFPDNIPMHFGCSYFHIHRSNDGAAVNSLELGCDYAHYRDERFEDFSTLEEAYEVASDALELIEFLESYGGFEDAEVKSP